MTLKDLEQIQVELQQQFQNLMANPPRDGKDVIKFTNAIELTAALNIIGQIIQREKANLQAPPGATGPQL